MGLSVAVSLGVTLSLRSDELLVGAYLYVTGLTDGSAQVGNHQSIQAMLSGEVTILGYAWGNEPDGTQYGTERSPTDFSTRSGGKLYLSVTTSTQTFRTAFTIVDAAYVSSLSEVTHITVNDNGDGSSDVFLVGQEPFAGIYTIETEELQSGRPVLVRPANWSATQVPGQYIFTPPLWLMPDDETNVFKEIVIDEGGVEVALSSPLVADPMKGYVYLYEAENIFGRTVAEPILIKETPLTNIVFSDSIIQFQEDVSSRQFVAAFRLSAKLDQFTDYTTLAFGDAFSVLWDGDELIFLAKPSLLPNRRISLGSSGTVTCSILVAFDLDGKLEGDTALVMANFGSGWTEVLRAAETDGNTIVEQQMRWGSQNTSTVGPDFSLSHFYWQHDVIPDDLSALRDSLFNADGTVIIPAPDGTAAGMAPLHYLRSDNFATGYNSGSSEDWQLRRNPIALTQA